MALLTLLVFDLHPNITKGFDPVPDDESNFFLKDTGIKVLFTLSWSISIFFSLRVYHARVPEALKHLFWGIIPASFISWFIFHLIFLFALGGVVGYYVYKREPSVGGAFYRTVTNIIKFLGENKATGELGNLKDSLETKSRSYYQSFNLGFFMVSVGGVILSTSSYRINYGDN